METVGSRPEWKFQRQFDMGEGVATLDRRPDLLAETPPLLLNDEQVRTFLANGFLSLQPTLHQDYHDRMFERFVGIIGDDNNENPGNNLLPLVPELQLLFDDPVIKGALTSIRSEEHTSELQSH